MKKLLLLSVTLLFVFACATEPSRSPQVKHPAFTRQKITELQTGLPPKQVESFFGLPDRTAIVAVGTQTARPWNALVYEYDMGNPMGDTYDARGLSPEQMESATRTGLMLAEAQGRKPIENVNRFYFSLNYDPPLLTYWTINRAY